MEETSSRRERVNRLKRAILAIAAVAVMVPTVVCVIFGLRTLELSGKVKDLEEQLFAEKSKGLMKPGN